MNIVYALTRFPLPTLTGDRLRAFKQIEYLAVNHRVHVVCLADGPVEATLRRELEDLCASVTVIAHPRAKQAMGLARGFVSGLPAQVAMYRSPKMLAAIDRLAAAERVDIVIAQLARIAENVPVSHGEHQVIDFVDALSLGTARRAEQSSWLVKMAWKFETRRLQRYEQRMVERFDASLVTSPVDRDHLGSSVHVLPVGVDASFIADPASNGFDGKDIDILFTGNLGYSSNVAAAQALVNDILPLVPGKRVALVGARPAAEVLALRSERVEVAGPVDDLRPWFARARIYAAPMVVGSGLQIKLLEAMAAGLPVVTTPVANAALGARPDRDLVVAEGHPAFAQAITALLEEAERALTIASAGQRYVLDNFAWPELNARLEQVLQDLADS